MPELPEVETMRRGILGIVGQSIAGIEKEQCPCRSILIQPSMAVFRRRVVGQRIKNVDRIGKRVVVRLESADSIIFEPRMTGLVLVADPPDQKHLRLRLDFRRGPIRHVWFWDQRGLGNVRLLSPAQLDAQLGAAKLGPDALAVTVDEFALRLNDSRREIKVALLDQRAIAGIGNLYASEMLHAAGIHPRKRCDQLRADDWRRLHAAMHTILNTAIRYEGSTLSDGTYRNALNNAGGYQNHHRVYDRAQELCATCRTHRIERIVQAQRSTFFCRRCQPKR